MKGDCLSFLADGRFVGVLAGCVYQILRQIHG